MRKDLLTVSRVLRVVSGIGVDINMVGMGDTVVNSLLVGAIKEGNMIDDIADIIDDIGVSEKEQVVYDFFRYLGSQIEMYEKEITNRKNHVINLGIYVEDSEESKLKKIEESKDLYKTDFYFSYYILLSKNSIDPTILNIYESMMAIEGILCDELIKGSLEMLSFIEGDYPGFSERIKSITKYVNFYSFALDIYNEIDKMYKAINSKKDKK